MKKKITIEYQVLESAKELDYADNELLNRAIKIADVAHSPYSQFNVGAAVRMDNGEILAASNQENEAFPSGLCAERSVIFYAFSKYPDSFITEIAIAAKHTGTLTAEPTRPCGACIQVMLDAEKRGKKPIKVILGSANQIEVISSIRDLLPFSFENLPLKK